MVIVDAVSSMWQMVPMGGLPNPHPEAPPVLGAAVAIFFLSVTVVCTIVFVVASVVCVVRKNRGERAGSVRVVTVVAVLVAFLRCFSRVSLPCDKIGLCFMCAG